METEFDIKFKEVNFWASNELTIKNSEWLDVGMDTLHLIMWISIGVLGSLFLIFLVIIVVKKKKTVDMDDLYEQMEMDDDKYQSLDQAGRSERFNSVLNSTEEDFTK